MVDQTKYPSSPRSRTSKASSLYAILFTFSWLLINIIEQLETPDDFQDGK